METLEQNITETLLFKKDNNLDKRDNLDSLPTGKAIYGIFGRINGKPANCRHIGVSDNLRETIKVHFSDSEQNACLRTFMQSIKIKFLVYQLIPKEPVVNVESVEKEWRARHNPDCNEELNRVH